MTCISEILSDLGIGRKYLGRKYLEHGIETTLQDEDSFFYVTKNLYPALADHFGTDWSCVERDMRTAIQAAWKKNRPRLEELADCTLARAPKTMDFIDFIVTYLKQEQKRQPAGKER